MSRIPMNLPFSRGVCPCVVGLAFAASTACGQFALSPVSVLGTDLGTYSPEVSVTNMINQSGLAEPFVSGTTPFDTYFANPGQTFADASGTNNWQSDFTFTLPLTGYVDFDLGATYSIDKIGIWNRSLRDVTVLVSDTPEGLPTGQVAGSFTLVNHLNFPFTYAAEVMSFGSSYQGRYIRLAISSAHTFSPSDTFAYAIIGEVVVSAAPIGGSPTVEIDVTPEGDAKVTFTGILQSSTNLVSDFEDVPGNPSSPHLVPKASLLPEQHFRARGN